MDKKTLGLGLGFAVAGYVAGNAAPVPQVKAGDTKNYQISAGDREACDALDAAIKIAGLGGPNPAIGRVSELRAIASPGDPAWCWQVEVTAK